MKAVHAWIDGRVQGVWFRQSLKEQALQQRLMGWTRNLQDGRVEAWLQGDEDAVDNVIGWLAQGPELAVVRQVMTQAAELDGGLTDFAVIADA